jgi:flagellin
MADGITLTSGIRQNLFSLQGTQNLLEQTQTRLASGKRVQSALDDPINFFAAQGHQQRANDLSARKDEMGEAVQTVQAANNGIDAITALIESAKSLANSAFPLIRPRKRPVWEASSTPFWIRLTPLRRIPVTRGSTF